MGIRFLCHHCEKRLNVKTAQAGKEGQCPSCGETVLVPLESTIPSALEKQEHRERSQKRSQALKKESAIGLHEVDEQVTMDGMPAERRQQDSESSQFSDSSISSFDSEESVELFMLDKPQPPESMGKIDPIAESPDCIWYFRSRELGERGPLKGKAMRKHLDKGDVKVGCIVWREDWEDWLPAEKVFPSLVAEVKNKRKKDRVARAFKEANYAPVPERSKPRMTKNQRVFYNLVWAGVVLILILLFVLFQLVSN